MEYLEILPTNVDPGETEQMFAGKVRMLVRPLNANPKPTPEVDS